MSEPRTPDQGALLKRALVAIDQLQTKLAAEQRARSEPIAVIGIGCRFPGGADDPQSFWRLLEQGIDAVTEVPKERWDVDRYYDPDPDAPGKSYTRWGSFLKDIDRFDAQFFGISPREAVSLDPQQRLLLEVTWQSLENAGIAPSSIQGSQTAVYVGLTTHDYSMRLTASGGTHYADAYTPSGTAHSMAGGRLSYVLGLHGPNVSIDTACSSSLVAIHWAVQSLRNGEANLALAGGANLTLIPDGSILTSRGRMMSFDGRCKTFDASADGYVRGEGCGMIVLKRLSDAQRDGDTIMALIRGSALNQDGRSSGLTAPNGPAQEAVIKAALANAGLKPDDIGYIEAHGTGTSLGDPIEMKALGGVFGARASSEPLMVGSVKTNIGHTEAAAGVVGVIKAVLTLQHRAIPPHLHFRKPNPLIAWADYPIVVPTALTPWSAPDGGRRRAGVSSFGFSGTNAHVVLEEAPETAPSTSAAPATTAAQLLMLSAESPQALLEMAARFAAALDPAEASLEGLARTAAVGRSHFTERLAVVAHDRVEARARLTAFAQRDADAPVAVGRIAGGTVPEVVFMFTGQGAQYAGMGLQLYRTQPVFKAALDDCARALAPHLEHSLLDLIEGKGAAAGLIDDTRYTQPALFAVEYALARLWQARGIEPTAVLGHSVGEYVAACIAGVFSLDDGLRLIAARGRLMSALPRNGGMAAVFADETSVARALAPYSSQLAIAAVNGPTNVVISGHTEALDAVLEALGRQGIEAQRLKVSHAFHSPLMDPMLDEFEALAAQVSFSPPRIGLVSNLNGKLVGSEICSAAYWRRHLRDAVRFADSTATLHAEGYHVFLEVGPHPTLLGMAERCPGSERAAWVASLRKGRDEDETMLQGLGALYVRGIMPRAQSLWGDTATRHRALAPGYAFQRQPFWQDVSVPETAVGLAATRGGHPLLGGVLPSALRIFQSEVGVGRQGWLADHRIADFTLFPAAGFLELCGAAAAEATGRDDWSVLDFRIGEALVLPDDGHVKLQVTLTPGDDSLQTVQVFSQSVAAAGESAAAKWLMHASGRVGPAAETAAATIDRGVLALRLPEPVDVPAYYELLDAQGAHYGPAFRGIDRAWRGADEALGHVRLPLADDPQAVLMHCHPALLDACFQLVGLVLPSTEGSANTYLPVGVRAFRVHRRAAMQAWCHVRLQPSAEGADSVHCDLVMFDDSGAPIAEVTGLELRRLNRASLERSAPKGANAEWAWQVAWQPAPSVEASPAPSGRWLVLGDGAGLGASLAARLRGQVAEVLHLPAIDADPDAATGHATLLRGLLAQRAPSEAFDGIVSLWTLDVCASTDAPLATLEAAHHASLASTLGLAQALGDCAGRLWVLTRGAQAVNDSAINLAHVPAWGLAGVLASELPALRCVRIDLDPAAPGDEAEHLIAALAVGGDEDRVALRGGTRWLARLVPGVLEPEGEPQVVRLEIRERGSLSNLSLQPVARTAPGPGQVEIRVCATGLNFRDVLNALGMYPGDPGALGNECAGVVSAIGEGVSELQVGDEVISMIDRSFATWVVAPAVLTVRKPPNLSFAEAATIPVTFLTAEYALRHLGHMKAGDRVLIHAVTGGVGMAAAQLARRAGAEIFGTAGAPTKKALAASLGVHHVSDSRSLSFAPDVMRDSHGEGVDIVLNSLAGDFIPTSLQMLRKGGGHFIEIGKTGIWDAGRVAAEYPGVAYHALYLGEVAAERPEFVRQMLLDLLQDFERGILKPLPQRLYPLSRAEDAFRFMGQGQHVGKIVITQHHAPKPRADGTYLVTGGLGGLGLACAEWLAREGARHLVLLGRRAPDGAAQACIARLRDQGVTVRAAQADVSDAVQLGAVLHAARAEMPALRGILHAAGSIDDAMLTELELSRFDPVMAPKVRGTWNLHELTLTEPLDFFVMFSSGAGLLGAPGQGNYAAANCFMDGFAAWRRAQGRPALSINWGSWSQVGMASGVGESHHRRWAAMGLQMIDPPHGVQMLQDLLYRAEAPQLAALPLVRSRLPQGLPPFLAHLRAAAAAAPTAAAAAIDMRRALQDAPDRAATLSAFLSDQIIKVLALGAGTRVDLQRSLMEMGLDSLMAMELRNRIQSSVGVRVAVGDLLRGPSIAELASIVLEEMGFDAGAAAPDQIDIEEPLWEEGSL